jgi:hypothetical protein
MEQPLNALPVRSGESARSARGALERAVPWALGLVAAGVSLVVFSRQVFTVLGVSDFSQHISFARDLCADGRLQPHFLFELVTCGLAAPLAARRVAGAFDGTAVALASAAVVAKAVLSYRRLRAAGGTVAAFLAALALLFAMPLFNWWSFPDIYLGQVSPNVWHNPTAVVVLPLALLLFQSASGLAIGARPRGLLTISAPWRAVAGASALSVLTCLTKPNYLLAFLPCWGLLLADEARRALRAGRGGRRPALVLAGLLGPTAIALAWQARHLAGTGGGVLLAPLAVWRLYSPNIPASLLLSVAFPLGVLALHFRTARRQASWLLAAAVLSFAVLEMALLAEPGARFTHANFFWGAYAANYLLFLESAALLAAAPRSWRSVASWSLLGAHALAGIVYLVRLLTEGAVL